jgi:hypothetical protein
MTTYLRVFGAMRASTTNYNKIFLLVVFLIFSQEEKIEISGQGQSQIEMGLLSQLSKNIAFEHSQHLNSASMKGDD